MEGIFLIGGAIVVGVFVAICVVITDEDKKWIYNNEWFNKYGGIIKWMKN